MTWVLRHWKLVAIAVGILVTLWIGGQVWGKVAGWWTGLGAVRQEDQATLEELEDTKGQLATTQGAIREMGRLIAVKTAEAARYRTEAGELRKRTAGLEAARAALPAPTTLTEAVAVFRELGYAAEVRTCGR
jgi:hypothetical protein